MWITSQSAATTNKRCFVREQRRVEKNAVAEADKHPSKQDYYCTPTQRCCCAITIGSKVDNKNEQRTGKNLGENAARILISSRKWKYS